MTLWTYCLIAGLLWPLMALVLYRHARLQPLLSKRTDAGFAILVGFVAAWLWPIGILIVLGITGLGEGTI